jgi:hypothetical protein
VDGKDGRAETATLTLVGFPVRGLLAAPDARGLLCRRDHVASVASGSLANACLPCKGARRLLATREDVNGERAFACNQLKLQNFFCDQETSV